MGVKAIHDHVVFQFLDPGTKKTTYGQTREQFSHVTHWGFEFSDFDESLNLPRWVEVIATGSAVSSEIQPGMNVLVDALMWTPGVEAPDGTEYWRTSEDHVLAVEDN